MTDLQPTRRRAAGAASARRATDASFGPPSSDAVDFRELRQLAALADALRREMEPAAFERTLTDHVRPLVARAIANVLAYRIAEQRAAVDTLTGCLTRSHGMDRAALELGRAHRYQRPVALLLLDLDDFKQINDRCGHAVGDRALRGLGAALRGALRRSDLCWRHGGDEFVALLPETSLADARHVAERLRRHVAELSGSHAATVTASIGAAAARRGETGLEPLLARADAAMYRAKRAGGNAVRTTSEGGSTGAER